MTLAKQLNKKLDEIIEMRKELARMNADLDDDATLTNMQTGESQTKADAIELIKDLITDVYKQINKISNNGNNVNNIFTNDYYVNDFMQDREIVANANKQEANKKVPSTFGVSNEFSSNKNINEYTLKGLHDKLYPNDPLYPKAPNNSNKKKVDYNANRYTLRDIRKIAMKLKEDKNYSEDEINDIVNKMEKQYREYKKWLNKQKPNTLDFEGWQDPF